MTDKQTWLGLNPQQELFFSYYLDPKSETFSDSRNSAIKAGFSELYAKNLISQNPKWFQEVMSDKELVDKARNNLSTLLDKGDDKIKADLTKFTLTKLSKNFGDKLDITSKGEAITGINYIVPDNTQTN